MQLITTQWASFVHEEMMQMQWLTTERHATYARLQSLTLLSALLTRIMLSGCGEATVPEQTERGALRVECGQPEQGCPCERQLESKAFSGPRSR